jgi:hypothetical protein
MVIFYYFYSVFTMQRLCLLFEVQSSCKVTACFSKRVDHAFRSVLTMQIVMHNCSCSDVRISQRLKSAFEAAIAKLNKYRTIMVASPTYLVATRMDSHGILSGAT